MALTVSMCPKCIHFREGKKRNKLRCCEAFPEGIPIDFLFETEQKKIDCHKGIRYELKHEKR
ncbi:MAG: hypothetical protein RSA73_05145 [Anaerovoracaceae bacterium]